MNTTSSTPKTRKLKESPPEDSDRKSLIGRLFVGGSLGAAILGYLISILITNPAGNGVTGSELLHAEFLRVDRLAQAKALPEASITDGVLKITPLDNQESDEAELLTRQAYGLMPRIKITDLLTEVDGWCDFGRHFTNLRSGDAVSDRALLLTAILADGINLGLTRMADACPGSLALDAVAHRHLAHPG